MNDMNRIPEHYDLTLRTTEFPNVSLNSGFRPESLSDTIPHIVAHLQTNGGVNKELQTLQGVGVAYGMHAPMNLARERTLVSYNRRLPPFKSSMLSLDVLMGNEDTIDFGDFLNAEVPDDSRMKKSIHSLMEQRLNYN